MFHLRLVGCRVEVEVGHSGQTLWCVLQIASRRACHIPGMLLNMSVMNIIRAEICCPCMCVCVPSFTSIAY